MSVTFRRRSFLKALGAAIVAAQLPPDSITKFAEKFTKVEAIEFTNMPQEAQVKKLMSFNDMLNEHLHYDLLRESLMKRDYIFANIPPDSEWKGGVIQVPFAIRGKSEISSG